MKRTCIGCGKHIENEKLREKQDYATQELRRKPEVGDLVRLGEKWGIEEEGTLGIINKIENKKAEITFNFQTPFSLEMLEKYNKLSVSGGTVKKVNVDELERTKEKLEKLKIHKEKPTGIGKIPKVTIYSKTWEYNRRNSHS